MVKDELGRSSDTSILADEVTERVLQRLKAQQVTPELQVPPELQQELHQTLRENSARCLALGRSLDSAGSQADPCEMCPNAMRGEMAAVLGRGSGSPFQKTYQRSRSFWLQHLQMQKQDQQQKRHLQHLQQRMNIPMDSDCGIKQTNLGEMPNLTVARSDGDSSLTSAQTAAPRELPWTARESMHQDAFPRTPKQSHGAQNATCSTARSSTPSGGVHRSGTSALPPSGRSSTPSGRSSTQHAVQVRYDTPSLRGCQAPPASSRGYDHV